MRASDPSQRRRVPVRLRDIPIETRLKAAREEARHAKTDREREALLAAALDPSDEVFYIAADEQFPCCGVAKGPGRRTYAR